MLQALKFRVMGCLYVKGWGSEVGDWGWGLGWEPALVEIWLKVVPNSLLNWGTEWAEGAERAEETEKFD